MGDKKEKKYIKIIVEMARNPEGDPVVAHYRITENVKMKRVKDDFAEKMNESVRLYRFLHYDKFVADDATAKTLEMEDGDWIEVFETQESG